MSSTRLCAQCGCVETVSTNCTHWSLLTATFTCPVSVGYVTHHRNPVTDLNHEAVDGGQAASTTGPVRVCGTCGEQVRRTWVGWADQPKPDSGWNPESARADLWSE